MAPQVQAYLCAYAEQYDLLRHINFCTRVTSLRRLPEHEATTLGPRWAVATAPVGDRVLQGEGAAHDVFDAVMVCNGHFARANNPDVPVDGYQGQLMHAHNYRDPSLFAGARVMVVGASNSGTDLALEIGSVAREVWPQGRCVMAPQAVVKLFWWPV